MHLNVVLGIVAETMYLLSETMYPSNYTNYYGSWLLLYNHPMTKGPIITDLCTVSWFPLLFFYFHDEFHSSLCFHLASLFVSNAMRSICDVISKGNLDASYNGVVLLSLVVSISCPCHNGDMREDFSPVYSLACVRSVLVMLIISFFM